MKLQKNLFASTSVLLYSVQCCFIVQFHCTVKISLYCTVVSFTQPQVVGTCCGPKHVFILFTSKRADIVPERVKCRTDQSPSLGWVNKLILHLMVIALLIFFSKSSKALEICRGRASEVLSRTQSCNKKIGAAVFYRAVLQPYILVHISAPFQFLHSRSSLLIYLLVTLPKYNYLYRVAFFMDVVRPGHQAKCEPVAHPMIPLEPTPPSQVV